MIKTPFNHYQGTQTTLAAVALATAEEGHEQNASFKATETVEGYLETFFAVDRDGGAVASYGNPDAPVLPANSIPTRVMIEVLEAKAGSGTLTAKLGSSTLATITSAGVTYHATPGSLISTSAQSLTFAVTSDVITAGAVRIRLNYLRGG